MTDIDVADPEIRKTTPEELSELTGWTPALIRRAARQGLLVEMGILFVPSDIKPDEGTYMCALKPFMNWFRGEAQPKRQTTEDVVKSINLLQRREVAMKLLDDIAS